MEQASARLFDSLDDLEAAYEGGEPLYRRNGSPNQHQLERAMLEMERPAHLTTSDLASLASASGMSALTTLFVAMAEGGRALVAARDIYGTTFQMFRTELPALGIEARLVDPADGDSLAAALEGAALLLVETISNPTMVVADIPRLAALAHERGALLAVDNTFASPALCRPLEHGADIVMHSTTKYIGGHGDCMGGILVHPARLDRRLRELAVRFGPVPAPLDSWLALRGLRTLQLRLEAVSAGASRVAAWLESLKGVARVHYPGLASSPSHDIAKQVLNGGYGGMMSFVLGGGGPAAARTIRRLRLLTLMPSLADVSSTVSYPLTTSHRGLSDEDLAAVGVSPGMIRLSIGLEDPDDIIEDLDQALRGA